MRSLCDEICSLQTERDCDAYGIGRIHSRACLFRAAEAERLASLEIDPVAKAELVELARAWWKCAADYQYVEKLENFMNAPKPPKEPPSAH
jgi:hypothetical protein